MIQSYTTRRIGEILPGRVGIGYWKGRTHSQRQRESGEAESGSKVDIGPQLARNVKADNPPALDGPMNDRRGHTGTRSEG